MPYPNPLVKKEHELVAQIRIFAQQASPALSYLLCTHHRLRPRMLPLF